LLYKLSYQGVDFKLSRRHKIKVILTLGLFDKLVERSARG
jgi:hypothetical protein